MVGERLSGYEGEGEYVLGCGLKLIGVVVV